MFSICSRDTTVLHSPAVDTGGEDLLCSRNWRFTPLRHLAPMYAKLYLVRVDNGCNHLGCNILPHRVILVGRYTLLPSKVRQRGVSNHALVSPNKIVMHFTRAPSIIIVYLNSTAKFTVIRPATISDPQVLVSTQFYVLEYHLMDVLFTESRMHEHKSARHQQTGMRKIKESTGNHWSDFLFKHTISFFFLNFTIKRKIIILLDLML